MSGVWVGLETNNGELRSVAFEMLTAARRLADASGAQVCALVWGEGAQDSAKALGECGADSVVVVELSSDASARPAEVSAALAQLAAEQNPSVLLLADGAFSRSVAPALAQKLSASFVADVIDVAFDGKPVFTRLPYSGKVIERVAPTDASALTIASIRPKASRPRSPKRAAPPASARSRLLPLQPHVCFKTSCARFPSASICLRPTSLFPAAVVLRAPKASRCSKSLPMCLALQSALRVRLSTRAGSMLSTRSAKRGKRLLLRYTSHAAFRAPSSTWPVFPLPSTSLPSTRSRGRDFRAGRLRHRCRPVRSGTAAHAADARHAAGIKLARSAHFQR